MKKSILIFLFLTGVNFVSFGQLSKLFSTTYYNPKIDNFSFSFGIGNSVFHGDVVELKDNIAPSFKKMNINVGINYRLKARLRARAELTYYKLYNRTEIPQHVLYDPIFEASAFESNIVLMFDFVSKDAIDKGYKKINIYATYGMGTTTVASSPPKRTALKTGEFSSEDGIPFAPFVTFGGGLEYYYKSNISVAFEWGVRYSSSDNIDYLLNTKVGGFTDAYLFYGYKLYYAPTHGFSLDRYNKKHTNPRNKKKFLGLF